MSAKADNTADRLLFRFRIGDRVVDHDDDEGVVTARSSDYGEDTVYLVEYLQIRWGKVWWRSRDLREKT